MAYLLACCVLSALVGVKILELFRLSSSLGPLLRIIVKMWDDVRNFTILYLCVLVGFIFIFIRIGKEQLSTTHGGKHISSRMPSISSRLKHTSHTQISISVVFTSPSLPSVISTWGSNRTQSLWGAKVQRVSSIKRNSGCCAPFC
jgi:hypothetical protein